MAKTKSKKINLSGKQYILIGIILALIATVVVVSIYKKVENDREEAELNTVLKKQEDLQASKNTEAVATAVETAAPAPEPTKTTTEKEKPKITPVKNYEVVAVNLTASQQDANLVANASLGTTKPGYCSVAVKKTDGTDAGAHVSSGVVSNGSGCAVLIAVASLPSSGQYKMQMSYAANDKTAKGHSEKILVNVVK